MKVKLLSRVLTLSDPMDCSLPGSSVHGIFQARVLEWGAIAFSVFPLYSQLILLYPQLSLATRGEDWASQGQPKSSLQTEEEAGLP